MQSLFNVYHYICCLQVKWMCSVEVKKKCAQTFQRAVIFVLCVIVFLQNLIPTNAQLWHMHSLHTERLASWYLINETFCICLCFQMCLWRACAYALLCCSLSTTHWRVSSCRWWSWGRRRPIRIVLQRSCVRQKVRRVSGYICQINRAEPSIIVPTDGVAGYLLYKKVEQFLKSWLVRLNKLWNCIYIYFFKPW